jgi:hypothetical protein
LVYSDCEAVLIVARVHAEEAGRLLGTGQAERIGKSGKVRAIALTGVRGRDPDPMSVVFREKIRPHGKDGDWGGFTAYAMKLKTAGRYLNL